MLELNKIYCGDCLDLMREMPDKSVDLVLTDPPYGTTVCKWDIIVPFDPLWQQFNRILKPGAVSVITGTQPFTSLIINSNFENFRYIWYWEKEKGVGFQNANRQPMRIFEDCCVFYKNLPKYHPPKQPLRKRRIRRHTDSNTKSESCHMESRNYVNKTIKYDFETPINCLHFPRETQIGENYHPTQKPIALFEYLIQTYTEIGDTVLDPFMGSGTTCVACVKTGRNYIGIDKEPAYVEIARKRLEKVNNTKLSEWF